MKYLLVILFILLLACEKEKEGYCWECVTVAENVMYLATDTTIRFGSPMKVTTTRTLCDMLSGDVLEYEKEGTSSMRVNDGVVVAIFKRTTKCSLNYTITRQ